MDSTESTSDIPQYHTHNDQCTWVNSEVAIVMWMVAKSFAASVAGVNAHRVCAEKMDVSHVSHQPLASKEWTVADLTFKITRQHMRRLVLD